MPNRTPVLNLLLGVALSCLVGSTVALAQNELAQNELAQNTTTPSGKIELAQLPAPPSEIAELLRRANVQFSYGPQEMPSTTSMTSGRRHDALTDYKLTYRYRTQDRLQVAGNRQEVVTTYRAGSAKLANKHVVWFRNLPEYETFWTNRLVLHELDHVNISSDPRLEKRLRELLSAVELPSRPANQVVKDRAEECFQQVSSLVAIRYKELDRLTNHGRWICPKAQASTRCFGQRDEAINKT